MEQGFDEHFATLYGMKEAVIYNIIYFLAKDNRSVRYKENGKIWLEISVRELRTVAPYMTERAIGKALESLEKHGLIESKCLNPEKMIRTKSYHIIEGRF